MAAAGDFESFEGEAWQSPESGPQSGELVDIAQMTTGVLIRTEQMRSMMNSRTLREHHHGQRLQVCREDMAKVQRVLYETAEHITSLYSKWLVLHVTMAPDLAQIARMRNTQLEMEERLRDVSSLRMRYEYVAQEAEQHEIALRAFDRRRQTGQTGQIGGGAS